MTKFITIVLILLVIGGVAYLFYAPTEKALEHLLVKGRATQEVQGEWHEYKAPYGQFEVLLPSLPHHATETIPDPKTKEKRYYEIFVSTKGDGSNYSISIISFPDKKQETIDDQFLESFMNEMLTTNPKNNLKTIGTGSFKNGKSVDFNLDNDEVSVYGKAFLDGKKLYVLSSTTKLGEHNPQEYELFLNSFKLTPLAKPEDGSSKGK